MYAYLLKIFCFLIIFGNAQNLVPEIIKIESETENTRIEGIQETDWDGGEYFAFRGIPYAKPPIGSLRFKDPEPMDSLPAYIDARYDGHDCESITATNASEDCLVLNVYTKNPKPSAPLPVVVFIHFGGLYLGSSSSNVIGATYLLTKDVVLVTFNYRLGTLGFLNLGTHEIPGNAGFKDQVYAMRWIQKYIRHFGGNSADITLMGYSAGGQSVGLHLVSPMSKGLFHKSIIMSGALPPQTILPQGEQIKLAIRQSRKLNCTLEDTATPGEILNCLKRFGGGEISATLRSMFVFGKDHPLYLWRPVIERDFGQERFLTDDFYTLIETGRFQRVPLLIGFTDGEFCTAASEILGNKELSRQFQQDFQTLAPYILMFENQANAAQISDAILEHYTIGEERKTWTFEQLCNVISDGLIRFGSHRLGSMVAKYEDVYAYNFASRGVFSNLNFGGGKDRVEHMDDLMYLFQMPIHYIQRHDTDAKIVELYMDFVWDFIRHGKIGNNSLTFPQGHMLINEALIPKNGSNFAEATFWERIFPFKPCERATQ